MKVKVLRYALKNHKGQFMCGLCPDGRILTTPNVGGVWYQGKVVNRAAVFADMQAPQEVIDKYESTKLPGGRKHWKLEVVSV